MLSVHYEIPRPDMTSQPGVSRIDRMSYLPRVYNVPYVPSRLIDNLIWTAFRARRQHRDHAPTLNGLLVICDQITSLAEMLNVPLIAFPDFVTFRAEVQIRINHFIRESFRPVRVVWQPGPHSISPTIIEYELNGSLFNPVQHIWQPPPSLTLQTLLPLAVRWRMDLFIEDSWYEELGIDIQGLLNSADFLSGVSNRLPPLSTSRHARMNGSVTNTLQPSDVDLAAHFHNP